MSLFLFTVCCLLFSGSKCAVPVTSDMKSFSSAIKGGYIIKDVETTLFEKNDGVAGVVTEQWYTGCFTEASRVRIYVDGETDPSIDFMLLLGHGIGFDMASENANTPWNTKHFAHEASNGGLYNTYRIPFMKSVKITMTHPANGTYWYIVRGVENYPLILGDLLLPQDTKLKLYKNEDIVLQPYDFLTLANVSNTGGAIFMVTLQAESSDYNYLEACFRLKVDDDTSYTWLSSGTEDFFLSAYYFDRGLYHDNNAGCTYLDGNGSMSAYKFFERDPLLFTSNMVLVWRCGETQGDSDGCPATYPPSNNDNNQLGKKDLKLAQTTVTTYVWVYEYSLS